MPDQEQRIQELEAEVKRLREQNVRLAEANSKLVDALTRFPPSVPPDQRNVITWLTFPNPVFPNQIVRF